jgi:nucleotide-binding universal stress UspA family protein
MFKHILVPTDGSDLSLAAARSAVKLAKVTGAQLTAFHVTPAYRFNVQEEHVPLEFVLPADYAQRAQHEAATHLDDVQKLAREAGVSCDAHYAMSDFPASAIVRAVEQYGCDAIVMGSHGRKGLSRLLLGSQTQQVLVSTHVPVLVTH